MGNVDLGQVLNDGPAIVGADSTDAVDDESISIGCCFEPMN